MESLLELYVCKSKKKPTNNALSKILWLYFRFTLFVAKAYTTSQLTINPPHIHPCAEFSRRIVCEEPYRANRKRKQLHHSNCVCLIMLCRLVTVIKDKLSMHKQASKSPSHVSDRPTCTARQSSRSAGRPVSHVMHLHAS